MTRERQFITAIVAVVTLTGGCGRSKPNVPFGSVQGTITLDGKPLAGAAVMFEPKSGRPSYGTTDTSGAYALMYRGNPWGAIVGHHQVRITTEGLLADSPDAAPQVVKERLPKRYHSESTLTAEVAPGKNVIDFALTSN